MTAGPWEEHKVRPVMPESITPETFGNDDVAEVVYIPIIDVWDGDTANPPEVEMRAMDNEARALPVYTAGSTVDQGNGVAPLETWDLPPMPDAHTGEPRPPGAPVVHGYSDGKSTKWSKTRLRRLPKESPALEMHYVSSLLMFTVWTVASVVIVGLIILLSGKPASLKAVLLGIGVIVVLAGLLAFIGRRKTLFAGADWVGESAGAHVKTYELVAVNVTRDWSGYRLALRDAQGRTYDDDLRRLQASPKLWDLVYNGIQHSALRGAEVNPLTRRVLKLDDLYDD